MNRQLTLRWMLIAFWFVVAAPAAIAQQGVVVVGNADSYALSNSFLFFKDESAKMTLADIQQPSVQALFKPVAQSATSTNFGSTSAAIWLRVQINAAPSSPALWWVEVATPALDELDVFLSQADGRFTHQTGGDSRAFTERVIPHRNHVKPLNLVPGSETTLYMRVASAGNVSVPTKLWLPEALAHSNQASYLIFGLYFGLLIGLFLYNLLLWLSVRDHAYLMYIAFVAGMGMAQVANSGLGAQYLWPDATWWNNVSILIAYAVSAMFGVLFARSFLGTRWISPSLDRIMKWQVRAWMVTAFMCFLPFLQVISFLVMAQALLSVTTMIWAGAVSIRRRHPGAPYFALAWGVLFTGVVVLSMVSYGLLPTNVFTANALLISSAGEMILLSFALANRINIARRETELAQAHARADQSMLQALQQAQERHRSVIEHVGEGMVVVQDERIVFVNARAAEILEMNKGEITREGIFSRMPPDTAAVLIDRVRRRVAGLDVPERSQVRWEYADKRVKWLEFGDNLVPWNDGQGLLIFFVDVTERYEAEMEVRTALDRQQELNTLRSRFIAITSHEFRTPLSAILSAKDLLQNFGDRLPDAQKSELLGMIDAAVHRMTRMLERVLLLGQAESKMLDFKPQTTDVKALCQDLVEEARTLQPDSTCQLVLDLPDGPLNSLLDTQLMRHIFSNLLSNALKYSPSGGVVRLKAYGRDGQTVFEVSDQGIGVPAEEMANLFDSFHRASNVGAIAGTGLGLAIVKQTVDLHGGRIEVQSSPGAGTTFTVIL